MSSPSILIVEDELIIAADIETRLKRLGYAISGHADRGEDAIELARIRKPDLVLMDIRLQGEIDGITAADTIRKQFHIPVVFLTAHADEATLQRAKVTEPFGYILKPFEERELRTVLEMARYKHAVERKLALSERRYATTLSSIGDAVIATDQNGCITFMNPVSERLTGYSIDEATGKPLEQVFRIVNEETRKVVQNPVELVLVTGKTVGLANHTVLIAKDGKEYAIDDGAAPIHDDHEISGVVLVFRDVTEERRKEAELRLAQKMEAVGRLAGGIAHDFNNLLTVIRGYCSLLQDSIPVDHPWMLAISEIGRASERASDLTRQLLAFGRKQMLQPKIIDLNHIVSESAKFLGRIITETIHLETEVSPEPLLTQADPGQIEQIIINLSINARDAMPQGGNLRLISQRQGFGLDENPEIPAGEYAVLSVIDTGIGMDAATLKRIWEPFYTTKEIGKGTGLGLASVYGIVKQSGGFVTVTSEPGKGSTFRIYLPLAQQTEKHAAVSVSNDLPRGTETILLVEDDQAVRGLASQILRLAGYSVLEAANGIDGLNVAAQYVESIHLLVTDLVMPQMSGRTLAKLLESQRPGLKILYVSGYSEDLVIEHQSTFQEGNLLIKPFTPKSLAKRVRELLDQ